MRRGSPGHRGLTAVSSCIVLGNIKDTGSFHKTYFFLLGFFTACGVITWFCGHILMSDSEGSSDTTHELILHNLVRHHLRLHGDVAALREEVQALQAQLQDIQTSLQFLLTGGLTFSGDHGTFSRPPTEAERGTTGK